MRLSDAIILAVFVSTSHTGCGGRTYRPINDRGGAPGQSPPQSREVIVYFVRHAQSIWNLKKLLGKKQKNNSGNLNPQNDQQVAELVKAGNFKNNEPDVALSNKGIEQVQKLRDWINQGSNCKEDASKCAYKAIWPAGITSSKEPTDESRSPLLGSEEEWLDSSEDQVCEAREELSQLVRENKVIFGVSNLKRAIETMLIFLSGFTNFGGEKPKINIVSSLQELSGGTDAGSTLPPGSVPFENREQANAAGYTEAMKSFPSTAEDTSLPFVFDGSAYNMHYPKWSRYARGDKMLQDFCDWIYNSEREKTFVVSGHSFWLRRLFINSFGGAKFGEDDHADKESNMAERLLRFSYSKMGIKLGNGSVIRFNFRLTQNVDGVECKIVPKNTQLIFGHWQVHGKCDEGRVCERLGDFMKRKIGNVDDSTCPSNEE